MKKKLKRIYKKIRFFIRRRPVVILAALLLLVIIIIITSVISCSVSRNGRHVSGTGIVLDDQHWKENDKGFRYYDLKGYSSSVGIDVSEWVEDIDFNAVKKSGVDFVILRVGYRGYVTGAFVLDNNLAKYLKDARKAGLKIGVYFVSQAVDLEEAVEEAEYVMGQVKGYNLEMPVYIDLEAAADVARTDILSQKELTDIACAFCDKVEEAGYRGGVYANEAWFNDKLIFDKIQKYDIWLAKYTDKLNTDLPINMWQYSGEGVVDGTDMLVDLNVRVEKDPEEK